jgi:hypothetical protein
MIGGGGGGGGAGGGAGGAAAGTGAAVEGAPRGGAQVLDLLLRRGRLEIGPRQRLRDVGDRAGGREQGRDVELRREPLARRPEPRHGPETGRLARVVRVQDEGPIRADRIGLHPRPAPRLLVHESHFLERPRRARGVALPEHVDRPVEQRCPIAEDGEPRRARGPPAAVRVAGEQHVALAEERGGLGRALHAPRGVVSEGAIVERDVFRSARRHGPAGLHQEGGLDHHGDRALSPVAEGPHETGDVAVRESGNLRGVALHGRPHVFGGTNGPGGGSPGSAKRAM